MADEPAEAAWEMNAEQEKQDRSGPPPASYGGKYPTINMAKPTSPPPPTPAGGPVTTALGIRG